MQQFQILSSITDFFFLLKEQFLVCYLNCFKLMYLGQSVLQDFQISQ